MSMLDEIAEQPDVIGRLLDSNTEALGAIADQARRSTHVIVAARGTSDNAALYAQYVWGARNRLSVGLATPALFGPLASPPNLTDAYVVGISQSGESPDLVEVLAEASRQGRPTLAITNSPGSPLAASAEVVVDIAAGAETAVAATKTYSAQLAAVALCSQALAGEGTGPLAGLPAAMAEALAGCDEARSSALALADADRCVVIGRGFHHATAFEWALKLQELTYLLAQPFSAADFLHGPVAVVEEGFPVLVVATSGATYGELRAMATDMAARGAHVVTVTDIADTPGNQVISVPVVEPWLSPIVVAPALQHFAHSLAVARGLDPDTPRGLTKVTRTH